MALGSFIFQEQLIFDPTPTQDSTNPVTSDGIKKYVDAKKKVFTATIPTTGWTITEQNYVDITVTGVLESDTPHIAPNYTNVKATDDGIREAWNKIDRVSAMSNKLRVYASEVPATEIPVQIEIIR